MRPILIIAQNLYREARHNKVLHIAVGFAAIIIIFSLFLGEVSLYQNEKVVKDIGLASISLLGVFVAIFLGVNSLFKELDRRTIYAIISKPLSRSQFLVGKFLGMALVLAVVVMAMTAFLYVVTGLLESGIDLGLLPAIGLIYVELLIVAAIAILFSSFSTPFLSAFFTAGFFIVGRVAQDLGQFGERSQNPAFKFFAKSVQKVFDLASFNLRDTVVHKLPVYAEDFWFPVLYGLIAVGLLLTISISLFQRRDFK